MQENSLATRTPTATVSGTQAGGSETMQTRIAASVQATATTADCSRTRTEAKLPTATSRSSAARIRGLTLDPSVPASGKTTNAPRVATAPATTTAVASQRSTSLRTCAIIVFESAPPCRYGRRRTALPYRHLDAHQRRATPTD